MSDVIEKITGHLARYGTAKADLKAWLTDVAGLEVADDSLIDELAAMLKDVEAGGGFTLTDASHFFRENARLYYIADYVPILKPINATDMFESSNNFSDAIWEQINLIDFSGCTTAESMFVYAGINSVIAEINLQNFVGEALTKSAYMFKGCWAEKIALPAFVGSKVTDAQSMFEGADVTAEIDLSSADFKATRAIAAYMFKNCGALKKVTFTKSQFGKSQIMTGMFEGCASLESLDFSLYDTSSVRQIASLFEGCSALEELTNFSALSRVGLNIGFPKGTAAAPYPFKRLTFRTDLAEGKYAIRSAINLSYCSFEREGFLEMMESITDVSGLGLTTAQSTITLTGNPCAATLTDEDRAIAAAKGWTLVL